MCFYIIIYRTAESLFGLSPVVAALTARFAINSSFHPCFGQTYSLWVSVMLFFLFIICRTRRFDELLTRDGKEIEVRVLSALPMAPDLTPDLPPPAHGH
jgi:hypothetical protein